MQIAEAIKNLRAGYELMGITDKQHISIVPSTSEGFCYLQVVDLVLSISDYCKKGLDIKEVGLYFKRLGVDVDKVVWYLKGNKLYGINPYFNSNHPDHWAYKEPQKNEELVDIYFIQAVIGGPIKIGKSICPQDRLDTFQVGSPFKLRIVGVVEDVNQSLEFKLHKKFKKHRLHGEWFEDCEEIQTYIKENS